MKERIIHAALRRGKEEVLGTDHRQLWHHFELDYPRAEAGFKTDTGRFVGRIEAGKIALAAGQTSRHKLAESGGELHSSMLTLEWPDKAPAQPEGDWDYESM